MGAGRPLLAVDPVWNLGDRARGWHDILSCWEGWLTLVLSMPRVGRRFPSGMSLAAPSLVVPPAAIEERAAPIQVSIVSANAETLDALHRSMIDAGVASHRSRAIGDLNEAAPPGTTATVIFPDDFDEQQVRGFVRPPSPPPSSLARPARDRMAGSASGGGGGRWGVTSACFVSEALLWLGPPRCDPSAHPSGRPRVP